MKINFTWDKNLDSKIQQAIQAGLIAGTIEVERRAKANCPVGVGTPVPGNLKSSITRKVEKNKGIVFTDVVYGIYVEFGTFKQKAQYFMRKALFENWKSIQEIVRKIIHQRLS